MLLTLLELLEGGVRLLRLLDVAGVLLALRLLVVGVLDVAPSTPQGAGNAAQLVRPTQLCWFSQPHPEVVDTQMG